MTILEAHTLIEQGVQEFGLFTSRDVEPDEIDLALNHVIQTMVRKVLTARGGQRRFPPPQDSGFSDTQLTVDDFAVLVEKNKDLALSPSEEGYYSTLPKGAGEIYQHLLNVRVEVNSDDCPTKVWTTPRIVGTHELRDLLHNALATTSLESPLAELAGDRLYIYNRNLFVVHTLRIDYMRNPATIDFSTPGGGAGVIEFPDSMAHRIVDETIRYIANIIEQSPQKNASLDKLIIEND